MCDTASLAHPPLFPAEQDSLTEDAVQAACAAVTNFVANTLAHAYFSVEYFTFPCRKVKKM